MISYFELLKEAQKALCDFGVDQPNYESQLFFINAFKISKAQLLSDLNIAVKDQAALKRFNKYIELRKSGLPAQYILGEVCFFGREYKIRKGVFIPRPETELLVERGIQIIEKKKLGDKSFYILEVGFGSGVIGIELALKFPQARILAWDKSKRAYRLACENAKKYQVNNIEFINKDFFQDLVRVKRCFNEKIPVFVVSNPPYIPDNEVPNLEKQVRDFEPKAALKGGKEGLEFIKKLVLVLKTHTTCFLAEIGIDQKLLLEDFMQKQRLTNYSFSMDYQNIPRVLVINL